MYKRIVELCFFENLREAKLLVSMHALLSIQKEIMLEVDFQFISALNPLLFRS